MSEHTTDVRIYYADTDSGGIVYHANYIEYGERARAEFLRDIGHQCSDLEKEFGVAFVVKHIEIEYFKPSFLDDLLQVRTSITTMKNSSFIMRHKITRDDEIIADMNVALVCVDTNTIKPVRLPDILRQAFEKIL